MKKIKLTDGVELTLKELAVTDRNGTPCVMTLLRKKKLNPENIPEELLPLKDESGTSVLDVCIERFKEPVINNRGQTVPRALSLANKFGCRFPLHFRSIREILAIANKDGWSVAHEAASQRFLPKNMITEEILFWTDTTGCSVAYHAAMWNSLPEWAQRRRDILLLGNGQGDYVAHVLAQFGKLPSEMMTEDILSLTDNIACSVAYYIIERNCLPDYAKRCRDILLLGNGQGNYVAHVLAKRGELPSEMMTEDFLKLKNRDGCFVAYYAAYNNSLPNWAKRRKDILILGNGQGDYVAHVLARFGQLSVESMTKEILTLKNIHKQTVFSALVSGRHLSPEILQLSWEENTKIFEYMRSKQFQKQVQSKQV